MFTRILVVEPTNCFGGEGVLGIFSVLDKFVTYNITNYYGIDASANASTYYNANKLGNSYYLRNKIWIAICNLIRNTTSPSVQNKHNIFR